MPSNLALLLYCVMLVWFLRYERSINPVAPTPGLWVPVAWLFIVFSRLPSQWLGNSWVGASNLEEGNSLDRVVYLTLIAAAVYLVAQRQVSWGDLVGSNLALAALLLFTLLSAVWSDYPGIAAKRWVRDLGNYLIVLVILLAPRPLDALDVVMRRVCFILIPLSIVIIKYFRHLGVQYDPWSGVAAFSGASTSKNGLGILCLVSGLFFFWDIVRRWRQRKDRQVRRVLLVDVAFIGMTLWLLNLAQSATSVLCLVVGATIIVVAHSAPLGSRPTWLRIGVPSLVALFFVLEFSFGISELVLAALGRDRSMTGRTNVWDTVVRLNPNPVVGAGYETFWLGDRLFALWAEYWWRPTQAHNGYLEVYLNLGFVGLFMLGLFLLVGYVRIWRPTNTVDAISLNVAIWIIALLYNLTEANFFKGPMWILLLQGSVVASTASVQFARSDQPTPPPRVPRRSPA
jgi:exopolysaccharide production protein ExoQ